MKKWFEEKLVNDLEIDLRLDKETLMLFILNRIGRSLPSISLTCHPAGLRGSQAGLSSDGGIHFHAIKLNFYHKGTVIYITNTKPINYY